MASPEPMVRSSAELAIQALCLGLGLVGLTAFCLWVLLRGLGQLQEPTELAGPESWAFDLGLVFLFGLQHSGMARDGFKSFLARILAPRLERSCYVAASGLVLLVLVWTWQPLGGEPLWNLPTAFEAVAFTGALSLCALIAWLQPLGFFGLMEASGPERLLIIGPYRWVRHPQMLALLLFLWGHAQMPMDLLVASGGLSLYLMVAVPLEERGLIARFGDGYRAYRRRVPALLPWHKPTAPAVLKEIPR